MTLVKTPDIPLACKQSTSSVLVPSVSSVQKYKYMLSLLFFLFTYLGCVGPQKGSVPKSAPVLPRLCWSFAYFCSVGPAPFHPAVAGWCRFVVGCLLDGFCITNKGFSTVGGHWSQQVKNPTSVRFTVATADPSWVCNGAGGGISGGREHKLNISSRLQPFAFPPLETQDVAKSLNAGGKTTQKEVKFHLGARLSCWKSV